MTQEKSIQKEAEHQPIPTPRYRHATPSGPWPFLDVRDSVPTEPIEAQPKQGKCKHKRQRAAMTAYKAIYNLCFLIGTHSQQDKSGIHEAITDKHACSLRYVEMAIDQKGSPFSKPEAEVWRELRKSCG